MDKQEQDELLKEDSRQQNESESGSHLKRNHEPSKKPSGSTETHLKTPNQFINNAKSSGLKSTVDNGTENSSPSTSPPRKKLVAALKTKLAEEKKMGNMALAHEIALNENYKLPNPGERLEVSPEDNSAEANKKRMEKAVKEVVHRAFWDNVRRGLESDPPQYTHAFILLQEIKDILLDLLPQNRVTSIHKRIREVLDLEFLQQQAQNESLDVRSVAQFIINTMAAICAPARDEEVAALKTIEDIIDLFKKMYQVLDQMKVDLANFAIQTIKPHIQQQQFEYERSTFASLVQNSPDGLKKTREWLNATYQEVQLKLSETSPTKSPKGEARLAEKQAGEKKSSISPLILLKKAYTKLLTWDYGKDDYPETLQMDKKRFENLQKQVSQLTLVASSMITICGVLGQPLASHQAFLAKLKDVLLTITATESIKNIDVKDQLERISLQTWKEATEYTKGKGEEVEQCVTSEKESALKAQIAALSSMQSHPVYNVLHKRTMDYLHTTAEILASHSSVTPPSLPSPPAGVSFVAKELINVSVRYAKLVNLNQTVYGPFYVPLLRDVLGIPQSPNQSETKNSPTDNGSGARKKLDLGDPNGKKEDKKSESTSDEQQKETYKVTGSLEDLD